MMRIIKSLLLIIFIFLHYFSGKGQAVGPRCAEVMPNGDVMIHWDPLAIGTGFYNYTIFFSNILSGTYAVLDTVEVITQGNYLHTGAGANLAPVFYYIITNTDGGPSQPSDTLATMSLTSFPISADSVYLEWTSTHYPFPFLPDMHPWFLIYREFPPGNWEVVDSTTELNLVHHFKPCKTDDDVVWFRIGVRDDELGCVSFSSRQGEVMKNLNQYPVIIDSVSINAAGKAILGWQPAVEADIVGYYIFQVSESFPPTTDTIDYVEGRFSTFYIHQPSEPCSKSFRYIVSSIDSCDNLSPFPSYYDTITSTYMNKPHATIHLSGIIYDPCLMTNTLAWNEYKYFEPPLDYSDIYIIKSGRPDSLLATVLPGQVTYTHINLSPNTNYKYYVRAYSQDPSKSSTSCIKEITTYNSPSPLFMYTLFVTVEDNDHVNLRFYTDTSAHVQYYRILRSIIASGPFTEAGILQAEGEQYVSFTDYDVEVSDSSYFYQVEVIDSCGVPKTIANTARTILLETEALPDLSNKLTWNAYESWYGRTLGYRVYRKLDDSSLEIIGNLDSLTLIYIDNVSGFTGSISQITYLVEAYEGDLNPFGFRESSFSNEVLSEQEPKVYLPNAFMPLGVNNLFKPVVVFVGDTGYEFVIYNRWGQMVFSTENPEMGWNGTFNGDYVPQDVYVYLVRFRNALDHPRQIKGNVAVIY